MEAACTPLPSKRVRCGAHRRRASARPNDRPDAAFRSVSIIWNAVRFSEFYPDILGSKQKSMRNLLVVMSLATAVGLVAYSQSAAAASANGAAVEAAAVAASPLQQAQYAERCTRHGVIKCYREFAIGPYRCHHFW